MLGQQSDGLLERNRDVVPGLRLDRQEIVRIELHIKGNIWEKQLFPHCLVLNLYSTPCSSAHFGHKYSDASPGPSAGIPTQS